MVYSENAINILTAKTYKGIGKAWIIKNLKGNESIDLILNLLNRDAKEDYQITREDFQNNSKIIKEEILKLGNSIDGVVAIGDKDFPNCRGQVKNSEKPIVIFYKGDLNLLNVTNKNIAVIGLLNPDNNTEIFEKEVVAELVKNGATIISGLALGCDSIAHIQALRSHGKTVAILPSPLNNIIPTTNKELANEIIESKGLIISEYYENIKSKMELNSRYQERDRLQALFSDCIILSASYAKNDQGNDSGSRLAMEYAVNYSIPRAVIYNQDSDINNPTYDLNRQLINEDKKVTIIDRNNLNSIIKDMILNKREIKNELPYQPNLFDDL